MVIARVCLLVGRHLDQRQLHQQQQLLFSTPRQENPDVFKSSFLMKSFFWTTLPLSLLALTANAQVPQEGQTAPTTPSATAPSPADQTALDAARNLARTASLWNHPLDWKETGSSTADIVAHIKAALGDKAPIIEVRGQDTSRSTFVLKQAPLGPTLSSLAELANFQVWVFPGRLVIAPKAALSDDERAAIERKVGGEWKQSTNANSRGMARMEWLVPSGPPGALERLL